LHCVQHMADAYMYGTIWPCLKRKTSAPITEHVHYVKQRVDWKSP
jgi:hypothetical protein